MDFDLRLQQVDAYAASKGFALKSFFLDCIRRGQPQGIRALLSGPDYIREMEATFGSDLELARISYAFVWSQAQHAAVQGGLSEESASRIYNKCFLRAQRLASIRELAELNVSMLIELAQAVSAVEEEKEDSRLSPLVRMCRMRIRQHIYEELTVDKIADAMHVSRSHLAHVFKSETGKTVMDFAREEKTSEAMRLLDSTPLSLTEVAQKLGYSSQSYFSTAFRKVTGMTPSQYRRARHAIE